MTTELDEILALERAALDRWGHGDPGGFLDLYDADVSYFDPLTPRRIDGHAAMAAYYAPFAGKIHIDRYEMLDPQVVVSGDLAYLSYNLVNYTTTPDGSEAVGSRWNSTVVYRRRRGTWKTIHSHWSFMQHEAFRTMTPEASERQGG